MQKLEKRIAALEHSIGVSGKRPDGMTDAQFLRYLSEMPRPRHALFMREISNDDLAAVINFGNAALADSMLSPEYGQFMSAYERGDLRTSIRILKSHIETRNEPEKKHGKS